MMSVEPDPLPPEDRELEDSLKRLVPLAMDDDLLTKLVQDQARIDSVRRLPANPLQNKWLIFSLASCFLAFCGLSVLSLRHRVRLGPSAAAAPVADDGLVDRANSGRREVPRGFVPISSQGYLLNASSRGFIESEAGPREAIEIDYEEVEHWLVPETATNIRIYSPRREMIIVPVETY